MFSVNYDRVSSMNDVYYNNRVMKITDEYITVELTRKLNSCTVQHNLNFCDAL